MRLVENSDSQEGRFTRWGKNVIHKIGALVLPKHTELITMPAAFMDIESRREGLVQRFLDHMAAEEKITAHTPIRALGFMGKEIDELVREYPNTVRIPRDKLVLAAIRIGGNSESVLAEFNTEAQQHATKYANIGLTLMLQEQLTESQSGKSTEEYLAALDVNLSIQGLALRLQREAQAA